MVELNVAGWAVVLAPGAVVGGIAGVLVRKSIGLCALIGSGASWACALLVDIQRWRASAVHIMLPEDFSDDERARLSIALEDAGVDVSIRMETDLATGTPRWVAVTTMRFRGTVERAIAQGFP